MKKSILMSLLALITNLITAQSPVISFQDASPFFISKMSQQGNMRKSVWPIVLAHTGNSSDNIPTIVSATFRVKAKYSGVRMKYNLDTTFQFPKGSKVNDIVAIEYEIDTIKYCTDTIYFEFEQLQNCTTQNYGKFLEIILEGDGTKCKTDLAVSNLFTNNSYLLSIAIENKILKILNLLQSENYSICIYSMDGKSVISTKLTDINLSAMPAGIYILNLLKNNSTILTQKFVLE